MSEALPDPTLPIFGDATVSYDVPTSESVEGKVIRVLVDEIDSIEDERLRDALWKQYMYRNSGRVLLVSASKDGYYSHSVTLPTGELGVLFTEDGTVDYKDYPDYLRRKAQERAEQEEKAGGWFGRLLRKQK